MTAETKQPSRAEIGALLIAIGREMICRDLCAVATLDGNSDGNLVNTMMEHGVDGQVAADMCRIDFDLLCQMAAY